MYLLDLRHDFDFDLPQIGEKALATLFIEKTRRLSPLRRLGRKITLRTQQGRVTRLILPSILSPYFLLHIEDVVSFQWKRGTNRILYRPAANVESLLLRYWLLHTLLPLYLQEERYCAILHAGGVEIDGKAILFTAPSFGGKSTLIDYLHRKGHRILGDDLLGVLRVENRYIAIPSYPFIRPYRALEDLGTAVTNFVETPLEIEAIYHLNLDKSAGGIGRTPLRGAEKFMTLERARGIRLGLPAEDFQWWSQMSREIPLYRLRLPMDKKRIHEVDRLLSLSRALQ